LRDHQLVALRNKLLPVTASTVAAVMGFAALSVSKLRPIQELGIWTALGLAISWLVAFTLFPALQLLLRTPTGTARVAGGRLYGRVAAALPAFTRRYRRGLVATPLLLCLAGAVDRFGGGIVCIREVIAVLGPATFFRLRRYFAGQDEQLPRDPAQFARAAADLEQLLLAEPGLRGYVDVNGLQDLNVTVLFRQGDAEGYAMLAQRIARAWNEPGEGPVAGAR